MNSKTKRLQALFAAAASGCATPLVLAQAADPNPYYIGVTQSIAHSSNVFSSTSEIDGTYGTTRLVAGFDQPIGRQRFYGNAAVGRTYFFGDDPTFTDANGNTVRAAWPDNTNYAVEAGWDWETIEKLSGNLRTQFTQALVTPGDGTTQVDDNSRNLVRTQQIAGSARYGGQGVLTLETTAGYSRVNYSDPASGDSESVSGSVGGYYRVGPTLRLGTALRLTRTKTDAYANTAQNTEKGTNIDLLANWQPTVRTGVDARLSHSRLRNDNPQLEGRDFSGITGSISARYAATEKIRLRASYTRDAGVNGGFYTVTAAPPVAAPATPTNPNNPGATPAPAPALPTTPTSPTAPTGLSESSQVTNAWSLGASYQATAKVSFNAGASWSRAKLVQGLAGGGAVDRDDKYQTYSIGVNWAFSRAWDFGCEFTRWNRDLEGIPSFVPPIAGVSYSANVTSCTAQFTFR